MDIKLAKHVRSTVGAPVPAGAISNAADMLTYYAHGCAFAAGWWHDPNTGELADYNTGEKLMLIVSEVAEAMEADRKGRNDDHLPHRSGLEVELADAVIRIFDLAGRADLDLGGAIAEKLAYNAQREDHKPENRVKPGGKRY